MSVEFRQRKPAEYGRILWKRKWMILLPAVAISFAVAIVVWRLPDVYQSRTTLIVRPSTLTEGIVPQLSNDDLTIRINSIGNEVLSRTSLEPLIVNFNLYAAERRRGEPMELLVERMRKEDIRIELSTSREITNGFQIAFRGPNPYDAQKVTSDLASKYVNQQMQLLSKGARETQQFVETQLEQAQAELKAVDQQRFIYLQQNIKHLPNSMSPMVQRLGGLYEQQKAYVTELGRLRDSRTAITSRIGTIKKQMEEAVDFASESETDPKTTLAWAELSKQESQLESEMQAMLAGGLKPKNPDVASVKKQLDSVQRRKQLMLDEWQEKIEEKKKKLSGRTNAPLVNEENNLKLVEGEIARQEKLLAQTSASIADLETRVNQIPKSEIDLAALDREYATKKAAVDALLEKKQKADLGAAATNAAQADSIQVIDPASLPEKPVAPKRPLLLAFGLALGLATGLLFAAALEVPRLLTVQTVEDARHYTGLPVLVTVPELLTPREERRRKLRRAALAFASIAATVVSIPALALLLKLTHVFEALAI